MGKYTGAWDVPANIEHHFSCLRAANLPKARIFDFQVATRFTACLQSALIEVHDRFKQRLYQPFLIVHKQLKPTHRILSLHHHYTHLRDEH